MNYLVSHSHSGNTWIRYCVEYVTKRPTHGHRAFSISERDNNCLDIDLNQDPVLMKRHELNLKTINNNDIFILLLRHPSRCIKYHQNTELEFLRYYSLIKAWENHKGKKHVLYFSEIFKKKYIIDFMSLYCDLICEDRYHDLIINLDKHLKKSKSLYKNNTGEMGSDLYRIPKIFMNHKLIKKCKENA